MSRRTLREQIFKLLFRIEFNNTEEMKQQCDFFFEDSDNQVSEEEMLLIQKKFDQIMEHISNIDQMINDKARGWSIQRMGKVDLTIIRLAVYEILFDDDIPTSVAINEAVELAKKFGQEESSGFINGVLAKFA